MNGSSLQDKPVVLSYAVAGSSWVPIGSAVTNNVGEYDIQWVNVASGTFALKVESAENAETQRATNTTTLSFLPYDSQNFFHVESNSTVSALAFNSTSSELSFSVTGPNGTAGYVKATIAKSLVSNAAETKVYLDGIQLDYTVSSTASSWILTFNYHHSTHQVTIAMTANAVTQPIAGVEYWGWVAVAAIVILAGGVSFTFWRTRKKQKN